MAKGYVEFIEKIFVKGQASPVPVGELTRPQSGWVWYLPQCGVYHLKKSTQMKVVFDSSAEYEGVSLNGKLLSDPDLMNSLFRVLFQFRRETTAVMCDRTKFSFLSCQSRAQTSCVSSGMKTTHLANG